MKKSDYHMLVGFIVITPHLNLWVAVALVVLNLLMSCIWAVRE